MSRKSELLRLAAKQGWYAGNNNEKAVLPTKSIMSQSYSVIQKPVPEDEELAYLDGYNKGLKAKKGAMNPFFLKRSCS